MEEETGQRSRHNSGRSRHGSGKVRHVSGDLRKRFEHETSPKRKSGRDSPLMLPNGLVNGIIASNDDERIALINGTGENGIAESPEACNGHCTGQCGGTCSNEKISLDPVSRSKSPKKVQLPGSPDKTHKHNADTNYTGNGVDTKNKKSSDSEGDSDNHVNGGTDGDDDQQLLIRSKSASRNPTSPHWKARSRHSSSEGLRKRTRSRSDSESSEVILSSGAKDIPGVEPISETKISQSKSPIRPSSTGSRRRRASGKHNEDSILTGGSLGSKDKRRGSHDPTRLVNTSLSPLSSRQRHKSMDSAGLSCNASKAGQPQDNPSYVHKSSDNDSDKNGNSPESIRMTPNRSSVTTTPQRRAPPPDLSSSTLRPDHCSSLASPVTDDDTKNLIAPPANTTPAPSKPHPSPPRNLELNKVYRPLEEANPPVQIKVIQRDDSFSPRNHKDANHKLNGDVVKATLVDRRGGDNVANGNVWHLTSLDGRKGPTMNGDVNKSKLDEQLKSPGSVCSEPEVRTKTNWQATITLLILLLANLINYMDRVTIAGN